MASPLRRLVASGAAYQASSLVAGVLALVTLPLYTRSLTAAEFGWAEVLLTWIILLSILVRAGLQEALVRHWFLDADPTRRVALARLVLGTVLAASTVAAVLVALAAGPLSRLLLDSEQPAVVRAAALGLWAFTNLEVAYAVLRAREARRRYLAASLANVVLTVALTVTLVVALEGGATGYLLGNYVASAVVLLGLWAREPALRGVAALAREPGRGVDPGASPPAGEAAPAEDPAHAAPAPPPEAATTAAGAAGPHASAAAPATSGPDIAAPRRGLRPLLAFGLPVVPAEAAVFALNLIDRQVLLQVSGAAAAGVYAAAVKLATLVIVAARAFQVAWPPLVYSLGEAEAGVVAARVVRAYVLVIGWVVAGFALLREPLVALLVGPRFAEAAGPLPWLALGWGLYGLTWVFTAVAGRAGRTGRTLPAALLGLAANVGALVLLVPPLGATGAAIALVVAYVVALVVARLRTRALADVPLEAGRLSAAVLVLGGGAVALDLLLPGGAGALAIAARGLGLLALPVIAVLAGALRPAEIAALRTAATGAVDRARGRSDGVGDRPTSGL